MKAMVVAALAALLAGTGLAAQQAPTGQASGKRQHSRMRGVHGGWDAALVRSQGQAVQLLGPLCDGSSKDPAMTARQVGAALLEVENQMSALEKNATGSEKTELASFRSHESQARMHYTELLKATDKASVARQHALAIRRELVAARGALRVTAQDNWQSH